MKRKGWLIPILVFVVSFVSLIFYQKRQDINSFADTTNMPPILWSKSVADVTKIIYEHSGDKIVASRNGDDWFISEPVEAQGDALYIYNVISSFKEPLFEEIVEASPSDLTIYGIDELSSSITLYDKEGHEYVLIKGNITPNGLNHYVYSPLSNTVYTMPQSAFGNIKSDVNSWRNKELLNFKKEDVTKIQLTLHGQSYTIHPNTANSEQTDLVSFEAQGLDTNITNTFVSFLETTKIQKFITDNPDNTILEAYGFNASSAKVTIFLKDGSTLGLTIGNVIKSDNMCYAKCDDSDSIYAITYFDFSQIKALKSNSK